MGWLDNLASELDNQPGPSGYRPDRAPPDDQVTETLVETIQKEPNQGLEENQAVKAGKEIDETDQQSADKTKKKEVSDSSIRRTSHDRWSPRSMHRGMALGKKIVPGSIGVGIRWHNLRIIMANRYSSGDTLFVDVEMQEKAPFPNVTICFAPALNETLIQGLMRITVRR